MSNYVFLEIPAVISLITGGILCYKQRDGWGWFLFAALLLHAACNQGLPQ